MAASVDELLLRVTVDAQTGKLKIVDEDLKKLKTSSAAAGTEVDKLQTKVTQASIAFERKQRAVNNVREGIIKAQSSFVGFGGTLGKVTGHVFDLTNQVEDLEFAAKRSGKEFNIFTDSLGKSTRNLGGLGTASLVVSAAMAGWKIGTWINDTLGLGKALESASHSAYAFLNPLTLAMKKLEEMNGVTDEQTATLQQLNTQLQQQLWTKYGIEVDTAGMSVERANAALLAAANSANALKIALSNSLDTIAAAVQKADEAVRQSQLNTAQRISEVSQSIQEAYTKLNQARNPAQIAAAEKELTALYQQQGTLRIQQLSEQASASKKAATEAKRLAAEQERAWDAVLKSGGKVLFLVKAMSPPAPLFDLDNIDRSVHALQLAAQAEMELAKSTLLAAIAQDQWNAKMEAAQASFDKWQKFFSLMSSQIPGIGGQIMGFADTFMQAGINLVKNGASTTQAYAGAIGAVLSQIGAQVEGLGGTFLRVGGAIAQGFATGGPWGAVIAGVAALASEIANLFKHDWEKDVRDVVGGLQLSADLLERLAADAEEFGDAGVAAWKNLSAIVGEVGTDAIPLVLDGFSYLEQGIITMQELTEGLDQTFQELAEQSTNSFGLVSDELKQIISLARQFGVESSAISAFISGQLSGVVGGVNTVAGNMNVNKEGKFNLLQTQVLTAFNAMIANGSTVQEAIDALGPSFAVLIGAMDEFGFSANKALKPLLEMQELGEKFKKQFAILDGINQQLVGLHNIGQLDAKTFDALQRQATKSFNRILQDGKASKGELQAIAPTLNLLAQIAADLGIPLSKNVQDLIDLADAAGLIETDEAKALNDVMINLNKTIEDLVVSVNGLSAALTGIPTNINTTVTTDYQTTGNPPAPPPRDKGGGTTSSTSTTTISTRDNYNIYGVSLQEVQRAIDDGRLRLNRFRKSVG